MKKLVSMLFIAAMLSMALVSCGDDDEPVKPLSANLESEYVNESDTHFLFAIDTKKDSSSIYMYNIVFKIGDAVSPAMSIRVDAPVTVDKSGKVYTYSGTGMHPYMQRGSTLIQLTDERYLVTNLTCTVDLNRRTYDIAFDCHGGHFADSGSLKPFASADD